MFTSKRRESEHAESPHFEPQRVESQRVEPQRVESQHVESPHVESPHAESDISASENPAQQNAQLRDAVAPIGVQIGHPLFSVVIFDADSTLAAIEGIDWLGALRGADVGLAVQQLTDRAMMGEVALEDVYGARLDVIKPTLHEIGQLSEAYIDAVEPGASEVVAELQRAGVRVLIVSGGLRAALLPLAALLGVPASSVFAVELEHDSDGNYISLAPNQLLARQDGKPRVVRELALSPRTAMVGDGSTDAAVRDVTDIFIVYTRVARRLPVVAVAHAEARDFAELRSLLFESGT